MKLIFMGTPHFAVPPLAALLEAGHEVAAVYSQPPRKAGRGQRETPSPVEAYACAQGLQVRTPLSLKSADVQQELKAFGAEAGIVAAYGLILPKPVLELFPRGCLNIHPSALPRWRGAAPIPRTIMAGDTHTACCIMQMDEGLDTGPVLLREELELPPTVTGGELHDVMSVLGGQLLVRALGALEADTLWATPQSADGVSYAAKLTKEDARIDWAKSAREIDCQIRALSPQPGAFTTYKGEAIKILAAEVIAEQSRTEVASPVCAMPDPQAGSVLDEALTIACGSGALRPALVQRPGKKPMAASDMLRGYPIPRGTLLG